jgi:orotidine-5'-phosphate decarboxylase
MIGSLSAGKPTLCVGVDPHPSVLEAWGVGDNTAGLSNFARAIVPLLLETRCRAVKPQVAFFERHGVSGMGALASLLGDLRSQGFTVIGDAKRGDIGSTMAGYADAWLSPGADFEVDALTLVPFQGVDALEPALALAEQHGKGIFVLAATSNPEARGTQAALRGDGVTVAGGVVQDLARWVDGHHSTRHTHGVVMGATVSSVDWGVNIGDYPGMPILAPGFGHQGAKLQDARNLFPPTSPVLAVVARSVLLSGRDGFVDSVVQSERELSS